MGHQFGPGKNAWIPVVEMGQNKYAHSSDNDSVRRESFFLFRKNVWIAVVSGFRPLFSNETAADQIFHKHD